MADEVRSAAERRLVEAIREGTLLDLSAGDPKLDDPAVAADWPSTRTIRAELLISLITSEQAPDIERLKAVRLQGGHVTGHFDLEGATLLRSLILKDCYFDQPVNLNEATGLSISFPGCYVPGLFASQLVLRGNLALNKRFTSAGEVNLVGAHVGGAFNLRNARLSNPGGHALQAARLKVDGTMFCDDGFTANGEVSLLGAHIGSALAFGPSTLENPAGTALLAARLTVGGAMLCRGGLVARGCVNLLNAHIHGTLSFDGAQLIDECGRALWAIGLTVDGDMSCQAGFYTRGVVKLFGANISGWLDMRGATFTNSEGLLLDLERVRAAALYLLPEVRPNGEIDLTNARVGNFYDDADTWPTRLRLRGFIYESLENDSLDVRSRLRWLALHDGYTPGVYDQLAAAYRRAGHIEAARLVSIAKLKRRRGELNVAGKIWNWTLFLTVGYGYRPWWAGLWLFGLLIVGSVLFTNLNPTHMRPTTAIVPPFQPVVYTLDLLLPIVDLGQRQAWLPSGVAQIWSWSLIGAGWLLTTAIIAGITNALKRD